MKYSASITILDDEGNSVFERELNAEEVSRGMGLELEEVRRTNLSDDYDDYLHIA